MTLSDFGVTFARWFGSALLGFAVLLWFGRRSENAETRRAVLASMFTYWVVSTLFALLGQLAGVMNAMGWQVVLSHLILAVAFGVFLFG